METPTEDAESKPPEDESHPTDETTPANEVESYESEWYEVLKRRAEELDADGDSVEDEDEGDAES